MAGTRSSIARRYAEAIFEIAQRDDTVDRWLDQLDTVAAVVSDADVVQRLEDPHVPLAERSDALHKAIGKDMLRPLANLIALVLRRRRLDTLPNIAREYRRLFNKKAGIVEATATSALPLEPDEISALTTRLEKMTGSKVELDRTVDAGILGGIQVRIGDTLYDGSVRGRLERLRSRLAAGTITP